MKLRVFRTLWGVLGECDGDKAGSPVLGLEEALKEIARLGYDGVELPLKCILHLGKDRFKSLLAQHKLRVITMVFTDGPVAPGEGIVFGGPYPGFTAPSQPGESDKAALVENHLKVFQEQVVAAQEFNPTLINCHAIKDYFTAEMAEEFFRRALAWQEENGYNVYHETHRKRFLHSPWVARSFMPKFPQMKMVADLSHWVCVSETGPSDPDLTAVVEKLAGQMRHTHCRVGYDHGPQVPDPRAPDWLEYMEGHERWWDVIWEKAAQAGVEEITMTPEHGPPNYQVCDPATNKPLADIWDVNHWIALRRQERFAQMFGKENSSRLIESQTQGFSPVTRPGPSVLSGLGEVSFK